MGFQKCHMCNGSGLISEGVSVNITCDTCGGKKIISPLTGNPPSNQQNHACQGPCYCSGRCKLPPQSLGNINNNNDNTFSRLNYNHQNQKDYFEGK